MNRYVILLITALLLFGSTSMAFDGQREGFIIGGGIGFSPTISYDDGWAKNDSPGMGLNFLIGFAWDEQNMIGWEANMAGSEEDGDDVFQGSSTVTWYHYLKPETQTFFVAGGLGLYQYAKTGRFGWWGVTEHDQKVGYLLGGGYEFKRHWQVGLYVSFGETEFEGVTYKHHNLSLLINGIAF